MVRVPRLIGKPRVFFKRRLRRTFMIKGENEASFYTRSPATNRSTSKFTIKVNYRMPTLIINAPQTTTTRTIIIKADLRVTITAIGNTRILNRPTYRQEFKDPFIIATPRNGAKVITRALSFFRRVIIRHVRIMKGVKIKIGPGVVPCRRAMFVTMLMRFIVYRQARPVTSSIRIRFVIRTCRHTMLLTAAPGRMFARTPVKAFRRGEDIISMWIRRTSFLIMKMFTGARPSILNFENFTIIRRFWFANMRVEFSVTIKPP